MWGKTTLPFVATAAMVAACGSCGGTQVPSSDRSPVPVTVTITNDRAETIYLVSQDSCGFGVLAIGDLGLYAGQSVTCEEAKVGPCPDFGSCGGAGVRPLGAGESWETIWDGLAYREVRLDPSETGENCPTGCVVWLAAEAGSYPVRAEARSTCEGESCDCPVEGDGASCHPDEPFEGPADLSAEAQLVVPESAGGPLALELHFR